jgi:hypothetical protein
MQQLDFSSYTFRFKNSENKVSILTKSGKIYHLTPEEWVRQHVVRFYYRKKYPKSLINVEKFLKSMG